MLPMTSMDVETYDYVTQRDPQLRGLVLLPFSALFLLSAAWRMGIYHLPHDREPHVAGRYAMIGFGVALLAAVAIQFWYNRKYGKVRQLAAHSAAIRILAVAAFLPVLGTMTGIVNIYLAPAFVGVVMAGVGLHHYPIRRHYLLAASVLFAFSLVRAFGVGPGELRNILFDLTVSAVLAIVGIGDHLLYVREVPARV